MMGSMNRSVLFQCASCGAKYRLTRIEACSEPTRPVACITCGEPLAAREGEFFNKYFLVERPRKPHAISLQGS
jgi:NAD-dependent SIR2 family protein deacetylase